MPVACVLAAGAVMVLLQRVSPLTPGRYPLCPLFALTGTYCPGCGALRGLHALGQGNLAGVLRMSPALMPALGYVAAAWFAWCRRAWTGQGRRWLAPAWVLWVLLGLIVAYWIARNVPDLAPWLAPGGVPAPAFR
ncbi:MAG: DUF2752 domain-containing protein [Bifidobacteriaceae bacterium]|jgi:hypothetical protein|nr:DUF2752 domain-containing protein [Bifidobacteriaceae bacterium]